MIALLLAGFALVDRGDLNLSMLYICTTLTGLIWSTLEGGMPAVVSIREALESLGRIEDIMHLSLTMEPISRGPKILPSSTMNIQELSFEKISYAYRNSPILAGISAKFRQGEMVALLGESGCGKSTLACVIAGLFAPDSGAILIDGAVVSTSFLRCRVEVVFQDANVVSGTITENLKLGGGLIDLDEIEFALKQACAHEFISQLPMGYGYEVGTYAVGLSTGQRQRIALARAFLSKPPILILDEATSGIDTKTEDAILENLKRERAGLITIIITHRLTNAMKSDRCLVLANGMVQREGTYDELYGNVSGNEPAPKPAALQQYGAFSA
jgi:ABC-type bacteriocin/lantibiotic exporter with double-glycine peptidase domain